MKRNICVIIKTKFSRPDDKELFFGKEMEEDEFHYVEPSLDLLDILVLGKFFTSKNQVSKAGWKREIPEGWSDFKIGKFNRNLYIFNPTKDNLIEEIC